jgi:RNA polymerase sigma-70 factor (ECF subfamily)
MGIVDLFRARSNPADRFERLIRPHIDTLYRVAYRLCQSRDDAEELVQILLGRLFSELGRLEAIEKLSPWLCRSLYNLYVDRYRSAVRETTLFDYEREPEEAGCDQISPFEHTGNHQLALTIDAALQQLNENQRILVLLHDAEGYTLNELTDILQAPLGTLKSRLSRARANLKKLLSRELFDDLDRVNGTEG